MMFTDADLIPLSALQHYVYCPRQCALIHLEQQWAENRFTAEGRAQHERVDRPEHETRNGIRYEYAVMLRSLRFGLIGKADAVEFHESEKALRVFPVEHKRGRPKPTHCDWVQLCAQAICLEEMLGVIVERGAVFYGKPRRRQEVEFTPELRAETEAVIVQIRGMLSTKKTPAAVYEKKKCEACSLIEICMPMKHKKVSDYLEAMLREETS